MKDVNAASGRPATQWIKDLPPKVDWNLWHDPLDRSDWEVVRRSQQLGVEAMLQTSACVQLSQAQVLDLVAKKKSDKSAFLCRAVNATWHETNGFEIKTSDDGDLWIGAAALSHRTVPIERRAVVVWLERSPRNVYVTFGVYE